MAKNSANNSNYRTVLGFTLSKKGWNNVLIYLVLILMFVFYFMQHDSGKIASQGGWQPFSERTLVAISDHQLALIRVGNEWQVQRGEPLAVDAQNRWLSAWRHVSLKPTEQLLQGREYQVELTFADDPKTVRIGVFFYNDQALLALPGADTVFRVTSSPRDLQAHHF